MTRLVLLSGWAIDARVFAPLAPHWSQGWDVHAIDWPGMGTKSSSPLADPGSISQLAEAMSPELLPDQDTSVVWVGWSLGALQAAALARVMGPPDALVLIGMGRPSATPQGSANRHSPTSTAPFTVTQTGQSSTSYAGSYRQSLSLARHWRRSRRC